MCQCTDDKRLKIACNVVKNNYDKHTIDIYFVSKEKKTCFKIAASKRNTPLA